MTTAAEPGRCLARSEQSVYLVIKAERSMRTFTAVVERDPDTGTYVGYIPGFPGAHSQGDSVEELEKNLSEVISMLLEDGDPPLESEFIGTQTIRVA